MRFLLVFLLLALSINVSALAEDSENSAFSDEPIQPVQMPPNLDPAKIELGRLLFHDTRLSKDGTLSCATCHQADHGGAIDMVHAPPGISGQSVPLNVPTFLGSSLNFAQFWDGRAASLEDQMDGPVTNHDEMGSSWRNIISIIKNEPLMIQSFDQVYHAEPSEQNIKDAISVFEQSQTPINSPFDRYLKGDKTAISIHAQKGYELFKNLGCAACHQGQNVGGNMFQKFGIIEDYFKDRGNIVERDYGRFNVTKAEDDRYVFKVPSLRNIALTAPYFHDGSAPTLERAVDVMAKYQLGRELSQEERASIVEFLKTLTGTIPSSETKTSDEK